MRDDLSADYARELFHYDPLTGALSWRESPANNVPAGSPAGCMKRGYRAVKLGKRQYLVHRLVWLHVYGQWPTKILDHINCKRDDNRIENLREVTAAQNAANSRPKSQSGYKGVRYANGRWRAYIASGGKVHSLGTYRSPDEAQEAYFLKAKELFGEFAWRGA